MEESQHECWVFGYGSLCWFPGFEFEQCINGYIRHYARRFWQGNTTHRGTNEAPGVVATLVEDEESITCGSAYKVVGKVALDYLKMRECTLGGYITKVLPFYPRYAQEGTEWTGEPISVLVYIATEANEHWIGEKPLMELAKQIVGSCGPSGYNVEYLVRLAMYMRNEFPNIDDRHLFQLESLCLEQIGKNGLNLSKMMGPPCTKIQRNHPSDVRRQMSFAYSSRIERPKLRCLNI